MRVVQGLHPPISPLDGDQVALFPQILGGA
jgi:hypothetical protein